MVAIVPQVGGTFDGEIAMVQCPKCGRDNAADAVICGGCDYILDTSFLGDDILNDDGPADDGVPPPVDYGSDALILGHPGTEDEFDSFTSGMSSSRSWPSLT